MIYGIGTDILDIQRIEHIYQRYGAVFARRILTADEWELFQNTPSARFLAKRFAAKEAFAKAVRTGLISPVSLQNISILHDDSGAPYFSVNAVLQTWLQKRHIEHLHLSISDEKNLVIAMVVAEIAS